MPDVTTEVRRYAEALVDGVPAVSADEARARAGHRRPTSGRSPRLMAVAAAIALILGAVGVVSAIRIGETPTTVVADAPLQLALDLDGHTSWFLSLYNGTHTPSDDEVASRFTEAFVHEIPPDRIRSVANEVGTQGTDWAVMQEVERRDGVLATQLRAANGNQARLSFMVDTDGRIAFYTVRSTETCAAPVGSTDVRLDDRLADRFTWVLGIVNNFRDPSDELLATVFAPSFLDDVSADRVRQVFAEVRTDAPLTVRHFEEPPTPTSLVVRVGTDTGRETRITLTIEGAAPYRITGLGFRPNPVPCTLPPSAP